MKLLRVKILGENFRSLTANIDYDFNETHYEKTLSTKIFAGLNGSGKSNFLELLAEIFYYLERTRLNNTPKSYIENKNFGFELEYILPSSKKNFWIVENHKKIGEVLNLDKPINTDVHVRIKKDLEGFLEMTYSLIDEDNFITVIDNFSDFLPQQIIAYTSGENELLSNPFIRLRYHYFSEMMNSQNDFFNHRFYFLDQESNYAIFVANMLLGQPYPLKYIKDIFKIDDLYSFRITFNYKHNTKVASKIFEQKLHLLEPLKACATSWREDIIKKCLVLDFVITQASHDAFRYYYKTAFELFQTLYELQSLNLLAEKQDVRKFVINASKTINISDELSKSDPSDWVFRIEKIRIKKQGEKDKENPIIYYKSLSDGEHQFNEVIGSVMMMENDGCLFLMDEPETHFNPKWRAKMVEMLNQVSGKDYDDKGNALNIRQHEVIMTTHSPFIISDNRKEDVYKFVRKDGNVVLENPEFQTYGASVGFVLETIFDRDITISDFSYDNLQVLKESIKNLDDVKRVKKALLKFGESIEKFDAYNYLMVKEKEFKQDQDVNKL